MHTLESNQPHSERICNFPRGPVHLGLIIILFVVIQGVECMDINQCHAGTSPMLNRRKEEAMGQEGGGLAIPEQLSQNIAKQSSVSFKLSVLEL